MRDCLGGTTKGSNCFSFGPFDVHLAKVCFVPLQIPPRLYTFVDFRSVIRLTISETAVKVETYSIAV
jgi:hypothetical protein